MRPALGERGGEIIGKWTDWKPFPDPTKGDFIIAPFGPGC